MLNRNVDLRVEAVTAASEIRQLKREERRALKAARRAKGTNTNVALSYATHRNIYLDRMNCRREARLLHLTRMLLKGCDYPMVEPTTHERVSAEELANRVWQWEPSIPEDFIVSWLNYEETF